LTQHNDDTFNRYNKQIICQLGARMDLARKHAYRVILSAGLLHLKWDLACLLGGFAWRNPRQALMQIRAAYRAAKRAYAFHNLAIVSTFDFEGFSEDTFWDGLEKFQREHAESLWPYRVIFERCLRGEEVNIISPDGVGSPAVASYPATSQH
jgi:hypothetical protein